MRRRRRNPGLLDELIYVGAAAGIAYVAYRAYKNQNSAPNLLTGDPLAIIAAVPTPANPGLGQGSYSPVTNSYNY